MLQLSRGLPQVGIDACLPSAAGLAIGREDVVIKTKLHRLLWIFLFDDEIVIQLD